MDQLCGLPDFVGAEEVGTLLDGAGPTGEELDGAELDGAELGAALDWELGEVEVVGAAVQGSVGLAETQEHRAAAAASIAPMLATPHADTTQP